MYIHHRAHLSLRPSSLPPLPRYLLAGPRPAPSVIPASKELMDLLMRLSLPPFPADPAPSTSASSSVHANPASPAESASAWAFRDHRALVAVELLTSVLPEALEVRRRRRSVGYGEGGG